jgi:hypothetical protein
MLPDSECEKIWTAWRHQAEQDSIIDKARDVKSQVEEILL